MRRVMAVAAMLGLLLICLAMVCLASCSPKITPQVSRQSDSVRIVHKTEYVERWRDTVVYVEIPVETKQQVKKESSHLETSMAVSDAWLEEGLLYHSLENRQRSMPVILPVKDTELRERADSVVFRDVYVKDVVELRYIPKSYWWLLTITIVSAGWVIRNVIRRLR